MSNAIAVKTTVVSYDAGSGFVDFAELTDVTGLTDGWDTEDVSSYGPSLGHERAKVMKAISDVSLDIIFIQSEFNTLQTMKDSPDVFDFKVILPATSGSFTFAALVSNIEMNMEITNVLRAIITLAVDENGIIYTP